MATITTADLIAKFQYALNNKWGYILNAAGELWTQEKQNKTTNQNAKLYGQQWVGHRVSDCSGLFYWAFKELGGYMYHGSNTMWKKYCASQGSLKNGKRTDGKDLKPGTAVFVLKNGTDRSHVGLYIGDGTVIEAQGTKAGVVTSQITNKKWAEWGELIGVSYGATTTSSTSTQQEVKPVSNTTSEKTTGSATVNDTRVALREYPSTKATILTRVDKGQRVQTLETEWVRVSYMGKTGWMMKKFLS